jgi:hypothetical protein
MDRLTQIRKTLGFAKDKDLAIFNELTNITSKLEDLTQKEYTDMSSTNDLLQEVVSELQKPTTVHLILD